LNLGDSFQNKQMLGIPWRVVFALQADGWYLRSDIIWAKGISFNDKYSGSCMPDSVQDRPTKSHEYLFLLAKSKKYFYDIDAVKEKAEHSGETRTLSEKSLSKRQATGMGVKPSGNATKDKYVILSRRNLRTVWTINPQPYKGAHFACYPPALIEPCIKAGTSEKGCCSTCGKQWKRLTEKTGQVKQKWGTAYKPEYATGPMDRGGRSQMETGGVATGMINTYKTIDWIADCNCNAEITKSTVLDIFGGSGTTATVAELLGRNSILIELNHDYVELMKERIRKISLPMFPVEYNVVSTERQ
jgi:hypothetical protein